MTTLQHDDQQIRTQPGAAAPGDGPEAALGYWRRKLDGLPRLDLPADRPHAAARSAKTRSVPVRAGAGAVTPLRRIAQAEDTSLYVVLLAAYKVLLAHLTGQRDVVVGASPDGQGTGRPSVLLRTGLDGTPSFRQVVHRVRATVQEARRHALALDQVAAALDPRAAGGQAPVIQAVFDLAPRAGHAGNGSPHTTGRADAGGPQAGGRWELALVLHDGPDGLAGKLSYPAGRFGRPAVARYAAMFAHLLGLLAAAPDQPVFALSPVPPAERDRILYALHPYRRPDIGYTTMAQPFEEQVRRTPGAVALVSDRGSLTYAELNARANRLARHLRAVGARPGGFVAVSMHRSLELMVALYAVAKSGAAYVPIDPGLPDARMAFMLEDSAPVAVLADDRTRPRIPAGPWQVLAVDADAPRWADQPAGDLPPEPGNHLIHMLYTSGTTGRPKAVAYPVDGALADIFWYHRSYPYGPGDTALFKTSYGFDVSIWEIFWPLYCGSRVAICPPDAHRDPALLRDTIDRYQVTTMFMVPSMMPPFYACTQAGSCPSLRWVFCGGEPITPRVRDGFHERFAAGIINCYGPTELGCVAETLLPVEPNAPVPVGLPPEHRRVYVLDENLQPAPVGVPGELYVGGEVGIAQSYHRRPGLTAERFLPDPFGLPGGRMYRTGDLCRFRGDGVLEHLGRIGRQVKIRGVRIELAEIEAVLAEHPGVAQCVVSVVPGRDGEIAAFVAPSAGQPVSIPELVSHARRLLPEHMIPASVTEVDSIPTFVNGKIDIEQLLGRIDRNSATAPHPVVGPATPSEARVAGVFQRILGVGEVSVTASFFALGGHSLLIFRLIELCTAEFGVQLAVKEVLEALTARKLAALIDEQAARGGGR
jgi:amino acid adenylation domain-containing protein